MFISELTVGFSAVVAKEREEGGRELQELGAPSREDGILQSWEGPT